MRQVGIIAAAGLVALDTIVPGLDTDHAKVRRIAEGKFLNFLYCWSTWSNTEFILKIQCFMSVKRCATTIWARCAFSSSLIFKSPSHVRAFSISYAIGVVFLSKDCPSLKVPLENWAQSFVLINIKALRAKWWIVTHRYSFYSKTNLIQISWSFHKLTRSTE